MALKSLNQPLSEHPRDRANAERARLRELARRATERTDLSHRGDPTTLRRGRAD